MNSNFFNYFLLSMSIMLGLTVFSSCKETQSTESSSTTPINNIPGSGQSMPLPGSGQNNNQDQNLNWKSMSTVNQPALRAFSTSVWTGSEMIVWGGNYGYETLATGGAYNPTTDTWRTLSIAPEGRSRHSAVWTGQKMFIYGGRSSINFRKPAYPFLVYDPLTDTWSSEGASGAPAAVEWTSATWNGYEIIVYGGKLIDVSERVFTNTTYAYNPTSHSWRTLASGPIALSGHAAIWTGYEMIVVGGSTLNNSSSNGIINNRNNSIFVLDPINNYWATLPYSAPGIAELSQTGTGIMYIENSIYALCAFSSQLGNSNRMLKFSVGVSTTFYNYMLTQPAPSCDYSTSVWTGTEILAWGSWYTPFNSAIMPPTSQLALGLRISREPVEVNFVTKDLFNLSNSNGLAEARSVAIAPNGDIYTAGLAIDNSLFKWIVRKSSDSGNTWQTIDTYHYANGSPANANAIAIDSTGTIYVGGFASNAPNGGTLYGVVRKSTNQGATWTTVLSFTDTPLQSGFANGVLGLSIDKNDNIYAIGSDGKWVTKRSADGGANWTNVDSYALVSGRHASATGITQDNVGNIYVVGFGSHTDNSWSMIIRKSSDAGTTWTTVDTYRLNSTSYAIGLSIAVDSLGNIYATGFQGNFQSGTIYPSSTWILRKSTPTGWITLSSIEETYQSGSFARTIAVDDDNHTIYVGGVDSQGYWTIKKSTDAGATWLKMDSSISGSGVYKILCTADKIYASGNLGSDWVTRVFTK